MTRTNGPVTQPMSVPTITPRGGTTTRFVVVLFVRSGSHVPESTLAIFVTVPPLFPIVTKTVIVNV